MKWSKVFHEWRKVIIENMASSVSRLSLWYWLGAVVATLGILLFCHWPEIFQRYSLYPDLTIQYVFNRMSIVGPRDIIAAYVLDCLGWLHAPFWYMIVSAFVRILPVKETMVYLSLLQGFAAFMLLFYFYGKKDPRVSAWVSALIFVVFSLSMDSLYGGMGRGFALLTTLLFFFAYLRNNFILLSLALILGAGFYLPIAPAMACLVLIECVERWRHKSNPAGILWAWIALGAVGMYVAFWVYTYYPIVFASKNMLDYKYVFGPPLITTAYKFGGEGLGQGLAFGLWDSFINCILNFNEHGTALYVVMMTVFVVLIAWGSVFLSSYRHDMRSAYMFIAVHIGIFLLMSEVASANVASRVCVISIPIACAYMGIELIRRVSPRWILLVISVGALGGLLVLSPHNNVKDFSQYKDIYAYLSTQKQKGERGIVAGSLSVVESIPFYTNWDAYYMSSWALFPRTDKINAFLRSREETLFYLLYGGKTGSRMLTDFIAQNSISYFILDEQYINKEYVASHSDSRMTGLFLPHVKSIVRTYNSEGVFPLMEQAKQCAVVRAGSAYLVPAVALQKAMRSSAEAEKLGYSLQTK